MKSRLKNKEAIKSTLWIILIILLWECSSRFGIVNSYILPPFSAVCKTLFEEVFFKKLGIQILNSLWIVLQGFAISFVLGIVIAVLCTYSKMIESLFTTLCTIFNPLPGMALLPIIMMWFGIDDAAMLAMIVHGVLWPLVTNLITGFKSVPTIYKEWAKNIGLKPILVIKDIYIYAVMPYFISGMRIGWGRAWRALISAEMVFGMIGSLGGVGYYIYVNRTYANTTNVMAGVLAIIMIGMIVEQFLFRMIEKKTVEKWGNN